MWHARDCLAPSETRGAGAGSIPNGAYPLDAGAYPTDSARLSWAHPAEPCRRYPPARNGVSGRPRLSVATARMLPESGALASVAPSSQILAVVT
jgi:hypothetical protein